MKNKEKERKKRSDEAALEELSEIVDKEPIKRRRPVKIATNLGDLLKGIMPDKD
jgi:hypothetical protein